MKNELHSEVHFSTLQKNVDPERVRRLARDKLVQQIAHAIADAKIEEIQRDFSVAYRISVVVADPDDYWRDVERAAIEHQRYRSMLTQKDAGVQA